MDLSLTDTQQMYVTTVQRFVKNDILPHVLEMDRRHVFPMDLIKTSWEMGIMNISIPESIKGYHVDVVSAALITGTGLWRFRNCDFSHVQRSGQCGYRPAWNR
jgi:alkylation response protein AidB-like acyl-CoA dehydrogenase